MARWGSCLHRGLGAVADVIEQNEEDVWGAFGGVQGPGEVGLRVLDTEADGSFEWGGRGGKNLLRCHLQCEDRTDKKAE